MRTRRFPPLATVALFLLAAAAYAYFVTAIGKISSAYFDSDQYVSYARNLLDTGVYGGRPGIPDMNREPGYGYFLAGLFAVARAVGLLHPQLPLSSAENLFGVKALQAAFLFLAAGLCAFGGGLPQRTRRAFFVLAILSPTCIGAVREIYSEALSIPLSFLLLHFSARSIGRRSAIPAVAAGAVFGLCVLTKSYLFYASFGFLAAAAAFAWRRDVALAALFFALAAGGITAQKAWNHRNERLYGVNVSEPRLGIAIAGKVARLDRAKWPRDLPVALAASVGTNFCDARYGGARCALFDYRGCDVIGNEEVVKRRRLYRPASLTDRDVKRDMARLYLVRPFTQIFGCLLEIERMAFFEAFLDAGTLPGPLHPPARAWHVVGSLLFWAAILVSWGRLRRAPPGEERAVTYFCAALLLYHAAAMSQITNVVRYVFPVLPFLYYFTADGIATLIERRGFWKTRA